MKNKILLLAVPVLLASCALRRPAGTFDIKKIPSTPDYSSLDHWAAHPDKTDPSDQLPDGMDAPERADLADVFFIHPTTYTVKRGNEDWNAHIDDQELNKKTDRTSIRLQSSAFNGAGKVWAPRYRQAHVHAFYSEDKASADRALDLAYQDVRKAFETFLKLRPDKERPIIIAGHSQGAWLGRRLVQEWFDGTPLSDKLIVAYLIGIRVPLENFRMIVPCEDEDDLSCLAGWRSFKKGFEPKWLEKEQNVLVTNPLTWERNGDWADRTENLGGIYTDMEVRENWVGAGIHQSILWTDKPRFPGSFLFFTRNYHAGDINLFYLNIRKNAIRRAEAWYQNAESNE